MVGTKPCTRLSFWDVKHKKNKVGDWYIACYFHICLIVGLKIKMRRFVWCLRTRIFRNDWDHLDGSPACCSGYAWDLAGRCSLSKTTLKSHSVRIVLCLLLLLATAQNNCMSVKEDAFLFLCTRPPPPAPVLFTCSVWQQFVSSHLLCFPCIVSQPVSLLFMWVFHTASRKEMFKNGEMQFLVHKKPYPQAGENWSLGQVW